MTNSNVLFSFVLKRMLMFQVQSVMQLSSSNGLISMPYIHTYIHTYNHTIHTLTRTFTYTYIYKCSLIRHVTICIHIRNLAFAKVFTNTFPRLANPLYKYLAACPRMFSQDAVGSNVDEAAMAECPPPLEPWIQSGMLQASVQTL